MQSDGTTLGTFAGRHVEYYPWYFPIIRFRRFGRVVTGRALAVWDWAGEVISKVLARLHGRWRYALSVARVVIAVRRRTHLVDIPIC